ncbi:MAG: hypothetical protein GC184_14690 [Rhizobiales bacterium]|nr:hypothetical protein [Hyphomicrobiales bacterium]
MSGTKMPRDQNNNAVPVLRARDGGARKSTTAGAGAVLIGPFGAGTLAIEIACRTAALRYQTGDGTVVADANGHFIEVGERLVRSLGANDTDRHTHISIIRVGATDGTLEVTELE